MQRIVFYVALLAALIPVLAGCATDSESSAAKDVKTAVWTTSWREQIFPDTQAGQNTAAELRLSVPRNSIEPFQIVLRPEQNLSINGIKFTDLVCGQESLNASLFSWNFVDFIRRSNLNSRYSDGLDDKGRHIWIDISDPVRKVPAQFPEILSNEKTKNVAANVSQPLWVRLAVPANAKPGVYTGSACVLTSGGEFTIPLAIEVCAAVIPEATEAEALNMEIWSQLVGNFDTAIDVIYDAYRVKTGTDEWWRVMESFATLHRENRLNTLMINQTDLLLAGGTTVEEDGTVRFNWSFFDRFVEFFQEKGGVKLFALGQMAKYKANPLGWVNEDYKQSYTEIITRGKKGAAEKKLVPYNPAEKGSYDQAALGYVEQYLVALQAHLSERGWTDIFYHHIIDEAGKPQQLALYPVYRDLIKKYCPQMKVGDATTPYKVTQLGTPMDIWVMMEDLYEKSRGTATDPALLRKSGDELWLYTSCQPLADKYLNRAIDNRVWNMESLGWLCFTRGATGYLHWGLNQWNTWSTNYAPFPNYPETLMWDNTLGDASCVYPDKKNLAVRSSIRVEALREASEQYSLLKIAEKKDPQSIRKLVQKNVRSGNDYESDTAKLDLYYEELVRLASK